MIRGLFVPHSSDKNWKGRGKGRGSLPSSYDHFILSILSMIKHSKIFSPFEWPLNIIVLIIRLIVVSKWVIIISYRGRWVTRRNQRDDSSRESNLLPKKNSFKKICESMDYMILERWQRRVYIVVNGVVIFGCWLDDQRLDRWNIVCIYSSNCSKWHRGEYGDAGLEECSWITAFLVSTLWFYCFYCI